MLQSVLPIIDVYGTVYGLFTIPETEFAGETQDLALSLGTVRASLVRRKDSIVDYRPQAYMAYVMDIATARARQFAGFSEYVAGDDPAIQGWMWRTLTTQGPTVNQSDGFLIDSLRQGLNRRSPTVAPPPVSPVDLTTHWSAVISLKYIQSINFLDFNWVAQFGDTNPTDVPLSLTVVGNPSGFRATVLGSSTKPLGSIFDTVRLLKTTPSPIPGVYPFAFQVWCVSGTIPVSMELTIQ